MTEAAGAVSAPEHEISVICPVGAYAGDLSRVHEAFVQVLERSGRSFEVLYVVDGPHERAEATLETIASGDRRVRLVRLARRFGESAALHLGFERARGRYVLTITDRFQADPEGVHQILARLDRNVDVVVTRREPRQDALLNRLQGRVFHGLVRRFSGREFHDLTCGLRGMTREAALGLDLYGDLHRFIPILAAQKGYRVEEIPVPQRQEDQVLRVFGPGVYARRLLDILNVFFLTRFLRKPLRFFGLLGMLLGTVGFLICAGLALQKFIANVALSNRPLLLLGVLLLILGVQMISIGLIGEIVIFLGSRQHGVEVTEMDEKS